MKKLSLLLVTLLLTSVSLVNADETNTANTDTTSTTTSVDSNHDSSNDGEDESEDFEEEDDSMDSSTGVSSGTGIKMQEMHKLELEKRKQEMEALKEAKKKQIEANKEKIKANNEVLKEQRKSMEKPVLTEDQKLQLKTIMDSHKAQADEIKAMVASGALSKEDAQVKLEALRQSTYESVKVLVGNDEIAQKLLGMKKETMEKNKELRGDNKEIRQDFRQQRQDLRVKYREQFTKALGSRLDKMNEDKLNIVITRIDSAIAKVESNTKLTQTNKDKLLAQLDALKDLINEKLGNTSAEEAIDVDALLQ